MIDLSTRFVSGKEREEEIKFGEKKWLIHK